ncbi:MAG: group 1 truncated hemoglobin [Burkholderiales bacterium PBB4]|nr:MAG: group 1 truncated hemoglobin [Burkholderiales bacterium PBB4]
MTKKLYSPLLAALLVLGAASPWAAQAQTSASTAQAAPLYVALGEKAGITLLADDFVNRLKVDTRLAPAFKDANDKNLKLRLGQQFCKLSGGPCGYEGADMKSAHANMDITKTDFNALVEVLQASMDARGIPFAVQNQLLALLAPMHRDVITVR